MRRIAAVVAIAVGVVLVGFTFSQHLFSRAEDAQKIADAYRPLMSKAGLADLSRGFEQVKAAGGELGAKAEPSLQQSLGLTDQQFADYKAQEMPGIAAFDEQAPGVVQLVGPVIGQMSAARADYARADSIPTSFLSMTVAPWLFLGIGFLLIAVGAFAFFVPSTLASVALLVVGLGVGVAPLVLGIPGKVDAAVRVTALGRVGLDPATGQKAVGATALFDGMANDVQTKLLPAWAAQQGLTGATATETFTSTFPTLATFADTWTATTSAKSHALSDSQVALAPTFANADKIDLEPIPWLFIIPGFVVAVLAGFTLVPARRPALATAPSSTPAATA
jgi:hypothetical protein